MNRSHPLQNRTITFDEDSDMRPPKKIMLSSIEHEGGGFSDPPPSHFVLCGRGERTNRHPGNKTFRRLVDLNRSLYHPGTRKQKGLIAASIVLAICRQDQPGRFVRFDKKSKLWFDVGMKQAIKKTSQALREIVPEKKNDNNKDKGAQHDNHDETGTDDEEDGNEYDNPDEFKDEMENRYVIFSPHRGPFDITLQNNVSLDDELDISEGDEGEDSEVYDDFKQAIDDIEWPLPRPALTFQVSEFTCSTVSSFEGNEKIVVKS
jgi:hypothetical protein